MSKKKDAAALAAGATAGAVARVAVGKAGLVALGTGVSIGAAPFVLTGAAVASTVYTIFKFFRD